MKYKVLKRVDKWNWEVGDIVFIQGEVAPTDNLKVYEGAEPHKHVLIVADPVKVGITSITPH